MKHIDRFLSWMSIFAAAVTISFVVGVIGLNEFGKHEVTVMVQLQANEDPFLALPQVMPINSKVTGVQTIDKDENTYAVKVQTTQPRMKLLEFILGSRRVKNAQVTE